MNIIIILIAISLSIALLFVSIFCWSIRSGQYDDTITPAMRILFEDNVGKKERRQRDVRQQKGSTLRTGRKKISFFQGNTTD